MIIEVSKERFSADTVCFLQASDPAEVLARAESIRDGPISVENSHLDGPGEDVQTVLYRISRTLNRTVAHDQERFNCDTLAVYLQTGVVADSLQRH